MVIFGLNQIEIQMKLNENKTLVTRLELLYMMLMILLDLILPHQLATNNMIGKTNKKSL